MNNTENEYEEGETVYMVCEQWKEIWKGQVINTTDKSVYVNPDTIECVYASTGVSGFQKRGEKRYAARSICHKSISIAVDLLTQKAFVRIERYDAHIKVERTLVDTLAQLLKNHPDQNTTYCSQKPKKP